MKAHGLARIGRDAQIRYTTSGNQVANFPVAFSFGAKDSNGKNQTQWVDVAFWGTRAEQTYKYLTKGKQIVVYLNDLHINTYQTSQGEQGVKLVGTLSDFEFVAGDKQDGPQQIQTNSANPPMKQYQVPKETVYSNREEDGDIPF